MVLKNVQRIGNGKGIELYHATLEDSIRKDEEIEFVVLQSATYPVLMAHSEPGFTNWIDFKDGRVEEVVHNWLNDPANRS